MNSQTFVYYVADTREQYVSTLCASKPKYDILSRCNSFIAALPNLPSMLRTLPALIYCTTYLRLCDTHKLMVPNSIWINLRRYHSDGRPFRSSEINENKKKRECVFGYCGECVRILLNTNYKTPYRCTLVVGSFIIHTNLLR